LRVLVVRCIALAQKDMHFQAIAGSDVEPWSLITSEAPNV